MPRQRKNYSRKKGTKFTKFSNKKNKSTTKIDSSAGRRKKNFRFIQRSKEAEELQRRHKIVEDKYKKESNVKLEDKDSEEDNEIEEENAFESLLSTFPSKGNNLIESSSGEDSDPNDEIDEEADNEELEEESDDEMIEKQLSDEEIDEVLEEGSLEVESDVEDENLSNEDEGENEEEDEDEVEVEEEDEDEEEDEAEVEDEEEEEAEGIKVGQPESDPFSDHFDSELCQRHIDNLLMKPCALKKSELCWPRLGRLQIEISKSNSNTNQAKQDYPPEKKKKILLEEEKFASEGIEPELFTLDGINLQKLGIKQQLIKNVATANKALPESDSGKPLTCLQTEILSIISKYQDFSFPQRTLENSEEIRFVYSLHALNHILKTRGKIIRHNAKLKAAAENKKSSALISDTYRDQGLARPKVLIVLPFRDSAFKVVNLFVQLMYGDKADQSKLDGTVINYKRFMEEYTGDSLYFPKTNPKPEDYEKTFAGNTDDNFRIGISLTKKCIKLYTEFYSSDILIASPLGLRMIVGAAGDSDRDYDFLNSIEVLVLDQAELFLAQNWDHLLHVLDHMHLQPKTLRDTDFSRVRPWCLNGLSHFYRQTILYTSHELPEFRSLFNSKCSNYRGKVRVVNPIVNGSIRHVVVQLPQIFHKIDVESIESSFDKRFNYFVNEVLPRFKSPSMAHCMIYIPSYFDYVRIRNFFKSETINFVQICEYTKDAKIARARDMFFHSAAHFILYSERAHFFRRTRIKGIRHLIFYQPPCWPQLYPELINLMQESYQNPRDGLETSMSITVLYTKYDMLQVSSIIGTERVGKLLRASKTTHILTAGD